MSIIAPTPRTTLGRRSKRGVFDRAVIYSILDEALVCHVGFVQDGQPFVLPTAHVRIEDRLYIHGSVASRMLSCMRSGAPVCVTVTLLDGIVAARSAFHSSMNFRSVVILGEAQEVTDLAEKRRVLDALVEHIIPGRSADIRMPDEQELKATSVLGLPIQEVSAKIRTGPPNDSEADYAIGCWAGVIPLRLQAYEPAIPDPRLAPGIEVPEYVRRYRRPV